MTSDAEETGVEAKKIRSEILSESRKLVDQLRNEQTPELQRLPRKTPQEKDGDLDRTLKWVYGSLLLVLLLIQVAVCNFFFYQYARLGKNWDIPAPVISVWLSSTLVEIIGIVVIIVTSLFPPKKTKP